MDDPELIATGKQAYADYCLVCHGDGVIGGGVTPDLRYMDADKHQMWMGIVMGGLHRERGMVSFAAALTAEEATAIQAFVIERAHQMLEAAASP